MPIQTSSKLSTTARLQAAACRRRTILLTLAASLPAMAFVAAPAIASTLTSFEIERDGSRSLEPRPVALRFEAEGRRFELALENAGGLLAPGLVAKAVDASGTRPLALPSIWIGRDSDGSEARLSIRGDEVRGHLRTSAGTFVFEPSLSRVADGQHLVRSAEDAAAAAEPVSCGAGEHESVLEAAAGSAQARSIVAATPHILEISLLADAAFYRRFGERSAEIAVALFNEVDAITRRDLGVALRIVQLLVYTSDAAQPLSGTSSAGELLRELSSLRSSDSTLTLSAGGVTHLLTGRDLGSTNGIAWMNGVCDANYGSSLAGIDHTPGYLESILVAHELGHNLGAWHDGELMNDCAATPFGYVMWPSLDAGLADEFSACSRASVAARVAISSCLDATIPASCGNGIVESGEDCDAGKDFGAASCCRSDCSFELAGLGCGEAANACLDAVCDGAGACVEVPNSDACDTGDACTAGHCSDGECIAVDAPRDFSTSKAKFRLASDGTVAGAKIDAAIPMLVSGSGPMDGGIEFAASMGGELGWNEYVPASAWVQKGSSFLYKAPVTSRGKLRSAKIRFDAASGRATFRFDLAQPMGAMMPAPPTVFVLAGNRIDGQCAAGPMLTCTQKGGSYSCI